MRKTNRTFWNLLLVSPAILGISSVVNAAAIAAEATATAEANQVATAQSSESKIAEIAEIVAEIGGGPVAEPVAAAPATPEKLALNNSAQAAQTPVPNSADAEKLAKIEPDTSSAALQTTGSSIESAAPSAPASTAAATEPRAAAGTAEPEPQASDKAVESSQTEVAGSIEVPAVASSPATTPATKLEISQTSPAGMGGAMSLSLPKRCRSNSNYLFILVASTASGFIFNS